MRAFPQLAARALTCLVLWTLPWASAGIPFYYVCPFPWTRTRAFAQPLITPETSLGGSYNSMSHTLLDTLLWKTLGGKINSWRKRKLNLVRCLGVCPVPRVRAR